MPSFAFLFWQLAAFLVTSAHQSQKIHERMTSDERQQVFGTIGNDVPDYEIVQIHWPRVEKRSADYGRRMHLQAFGKNIELWLTPADRVLFSSDTPIYTLKSGLAGPLLTKDRWLMDEVQRYENLVKSAVIIISQKNETPIVIGHIGSENVVIASIPQRLMAEVNPYNNLQDSKDIDHRQYIAYHRTTTESDTTLSLSIPGNVNRGHPSVAELPYELDLTACKSAHTECINQCGILSPTNEESLDPVCDRCQSHARTYFHRCPIRGSTVYPRILVVVAYDFYKKFNQDSLYSLAYLLAFWNGVDLKYRSFENPKFRLNIAGIVLTEDPMALECIANNSIGGEIRNIRKAAEDCGKFWYAQKDSISFDNYDVIMTMTSYKLCKFMKGRECNHQVGGLGMLKGACARSDDDKQLFNMAIIQENADFVGISKAAHVLGHLFGAGHGGDQIECFLRASRLTNAHANDKYGQWSDCNLRAIQDFLDNNPTCLNNNVTQQEVLPVYLPGRFFDVHRQCHQLVKCRACHVDHTICKDLRCVNPANGWKCESMQVAAAEGTSCGKGNICLSGQCVEEPIFSQLTN
ncbi:zinc metalloproteinase homolog-disintegrin albolatin-like [Fopius arisanus]|uniref:Zinc metalloproteinase homolog-disintegrin albolatin-like n=1 Tax=Fopius arisanus TaxID=64838 RepID=A0A9R1T9U9_9HYME|nr:PREDICTED: zinc metalloproteinase homolog-disintegrin albolatin-like [Fopius arisanus]